MMKKFGWVFIGCGGIAEKTAKEILKDGSGEIVAVWNRTKSRAEKFVTRFGGKVYDTPQEAITAPNADGVYVATTADTHAHFTKLAISLGKPVLCEKPFTVNIKEAEEVFALAEEKNIYVAEAMWTWFNDTALKVREWVNDKKVGKVKEVKASFGFPMIHLSTRNRLITPALIGGALMDIGIYPLRYVYELFGLPKKISCKGKIVGGVDYTEKVIMDYGDFKATIDVSIQKIVGETLKITGSEGSISVPIYHKAKVSKLTGKHKEKFKDNSLFYAQQFKRVAEEIVSGKKQSTFCPKQSTLDTMRLLDECRKQMGVIYPQEQ
jgi:predicted dehydrogenase